MRQRLLRPIALVGLMGSGKSAVAAALTERLGGFFTDVDAMVEARAGASVAEVFAREGEAGFRQRESAALAEALEGGATVVATGGGLVLDPRNRALLRERCRVVWLEVTPPEAARRVGSNAATRPLLAGGSIEARLSALLDERAALYASVAELRVPTEGRPPAEVAAAILAAGARPHAETP